MTPAQASGGNQASPRLITDPQPLMSDPQPRIPNLRLRPGRQLNSDLLSFAQESQTNHISDVGLQFDEFKGYQ
jgi:hypothetical protein